MGCMHVAYRMVHVVGRTMRRTMEAWHVGQPS